MYKILEPISKCGILPIARFEDACQAVPFAEAIRDGGMPFMEILCRTDAALDSIRQVAEKYPDYLVGAGTILTEEQAEKAIAAGAKFLVTPGFDPELIRYSLSRGVPIVPGCMTPGEVQQALRLGVKVQKFFPADAFGGPAILKELHGPYPEVTFVATSVALDKVPEYLACPNIAAVGGLFMYDEACRKQGDFDAIREQIRAFGHQYGRA